MDVTAPNVPGVTFYSDGRRRVGTCSLCGGDVLGYRGVWMATVPPPSDRCSTCLAVRTTDIIPMARTPQATESWVISTDGSEAREPA